MLEIHWLTDHLFKGSDIGPSQYQEVIVWMHEMSTVFQFSSETFALGVCVLNSLLATVKVSGSNAFSQSIFQHL